MRVKWSSSSRTSNTTGTASWVWFAGASAACLVSGVSAKAILGIDLGSLYMKVALVQRGAPLEIVTNLHSKRKTEQLILFDAGSRFFGADADSLLARKPTKVPASMSVMLGRDDEHPAVKVLTERHYPLTPYFNETRSGLCMGVKDKEAAIYTPEELVAMVLNHAEEITHAYGAEKGNKYGSIQDCVLTVPSFATQAERLALIDAANLADFNVLSLLDENTAAALHFGMDKMYDDPQLVLFYNLGASALQVSLVKFHTYELPESKNSKKTKKVGSIEVLAKAWDSTLGGEAFDRRIVEYLADHFNREWRHAKKHDKDVRENPRAMTKLRLQANKVKHVLSANMEIPVYMDALHDDMSLSVHITRSQMEELCADLMVRAVVPVTKALATANVTLQNITAIEMIGGGMRVPKIQTELSKALGDIELGMHINSDESMALGASFFGANISTAFRVRHVGLTDVNPFTVAVSLKNMPEEEKKGLLGFGGSKKTAESKEEEEWTKSATMFKSFGKMGVKKTIAFTHDKDVHCALDYEENEYLPKGTQTALQRYNITGVAEFSKEMEEKGLGKPKISLQFELSQSGITQLIKAEAVVEETYTVDEEVEVDDDEAAGAERKTSETEEASKKDETIKEEADGEKDANATVDNVNATEKDAKKPKKTIKVQKEKKRTHKRVLRVVSYHVGKVKPYSLELMDESKTKLAELARKDMERINLEAARNKVESYIYAIKNKLADNEDEIAKVSTEEQRAELLKLAEEAEAWMEDDGYDAGLEAFEAKYELMANPAEKVWFRLRESTLRPATVESMMQKLVKVEELMTKWSTTLPHVTEEEKKDVLDKVADVKKWLEEKQAEQAKLAGHEDPAFTSLEIPLEAKPIEKLVSRLSKKPKPKPAPKKKAENKTEAGDATNETDSTTEDLNATTSDKSESVKEAEDVAKEGKSKGKEESEIKEGEEAAPTGETIVGEEL